MFASTVCLKCAWISRTGPPHSDVEELCARRVELAVTAQHVARKSLLLIIKPCERVMIAQNCEHDILAIQGCAAQAKTENFLAYETLPDFLLSLLLCSLSNLFAQLQLNVLATPSFTSAWKFATWQRITSFAIKFIRRALGGHLIMSFSSPRLQLLA